MDKGIVLQDDVVSFSLIVFILNEIGNSQMNTIIRTQNNHMNIKFLNYF